MSTNQKTTFAIVANVSFTIPQFLLGAFNAHHKENLTKVGNVGKVTEKGAVFFFNRQSPTVRAEAKKAIPEGYKACIIDGIPWVAKPYALADGKMGAEPIQPGQGHLGKALFAEALSMLTQAAQAAQAAEKAKVERVKRLQAANAARRAQKEADKVRIQASA